MRIELCLPLPSARELALNYVSLCLHRALPLQWANSVQYTNSANVLRGELNMCQLTSKWTPGPFENTGIGQNTAQLRPSAPSFCPVLSLIYPYLFLSLFHTHFPSTLVICWWNQVVPSQYDSCVVPLVHVWGMHLLLATLVCVQHSLHICWYEWWRDDIGQSSSCIHNLPWIDGCYNGVVWHDRIVRACCTHGHWKFLTDQYQVHSSRGWILRRNSELQCHAEIWMLALGPQHPTIKYDIRYGTC